MRLHDECGQTNNTDDDIGDKHKLHTIANQIFEIKEFSVP